MAAWRTSSETPTPGIILILSNSHQPAGSWEIDFVHRGFLILHETPRQGRLNLLGGLQPALIVLDANLIPHKLLLLCSRVRFACHGPILVLLSQDDPRQIVDLHQAGVDECLVKPANPAFLPIKALAWIWRYSGAETRPKPMTARL